MSINGERTKIKNISMKKHPNTENFQKKKKKLNKLQKI